MVGLLDTTPDLVNGRLIRRRRRIGRPVSVGPFDFWRPETLADWEIALARRSTPVYHATGDIKTQYSTPTTGTGGINSLASSSTWVAGYEWFVVDFSTGKETGCQVQGIITVGTTPTVNTEIRIYAVQSYDGTTWPDVFDGTASAETLTSVGVGTGFLKLCAVLQVDATTSDRAYPYYFDLATVFPSMPKKVAIFVTHNTGVNLNATAGNQTYAYQPTYLNVA